MNKSSPNKNCIVVSKEELRKLNKEKLFGLVYAPNPDKIIEHRPNPKCPGCGKVHADNSNHIIGTRQVIDITFINASVVEHQIYQSTCICGHVSSGSFPVGVTAPVQYGNNLIALTAYLSSRQYVPYARLSELNILVLTKINIR